MNQIFIYLRYNKLYQLLSEVDRKIGISDSGINVSVFKELSSLEKKIPSKLDTDPNITEQINKNLIETPDELTNETNETLKDSGNSNDNPDVNQSDTDESGKSNEKSYVEPVRNLLQGLVSDIHKNFPGKVELTKYPPYSDALKKISSDEIVLYYGISIKEDGVDKYFVIPSAIKIGSDSESRNLNDFYSFQKSATSGLNGRLKIETPAEVFWDEGIKGWKLNKKGVIKIES